MHVEDIAKRFNGMPDTVISIALIAASTALLIIALSPLNHWYKAAVLAWIVLP